MPDIMKMGQNPNYLGSWDLEELPGREAVLTIADIRDEEVVTNGKTEVCTVCFWTGNAYKPMILNITNKKTLCRLYKTKSTERLCGRSVIVGIEKVRAFGSVHDALRIRPRVPEKEPEMAVPCGKCGKPIAPYGNMTVKQMAAYTAKKYGSSLCAACAVAAASEVKA